MAKKKAQPVKPETPEERNTRFATELTALIDRFYGPRAAHCLLTETDQRDGNNALRWVCFRRGDDAALQLQLAWANGLVAGAHERRVAEMMRAGRR